jgi:O-antigen/teichoic acid export membrane protein
LKKQAVRGSVYILSSQIVLQGIRFISTIVMARLLTPAEFGLIAMIAAVTSFMGQFNELGLSQATIQHEDLKHQQVTNLFWINAALGVLSAILVMALAPAIVWFYHEPRLFWLTIALGVGFLFGGFSVQHQALIQRQMRIGTLSLINIMSCFLAIAVGIAAALMGAGVWALVYMPLVEGFVRVVAVWLACPWRPGLPLRGSGTWRMLIFGGNLTGANVVNYFSRNVDSMLIGRRWGAEPLGLYSKAYALLLMPIRQVTTPIAMVAIPALSRLQSEPQRYRRFYLKAVSLIACTTIPAVVFLIVMSGEVITVVLGRQWTGASAIFAILGVCALIQPVLNSTGWLYVSIGRTDRMFKGTIVWSIAAVASFFIGLPYGAVGVATAYTIFNLVFVIPFIHYAVEPTPVRTVDVLKAVWLWFAAGLIAGGSLYLLKAFFPQLMCGIMGIVIGVLETAVVYLGVVCILAGGVAPLRELIDLVRQFRRGEEASPK